VLQIKPNVATSLTAMLHLCASDRAIAHPVAPVMRFPCRQTITANVPLRDIRFLIRLIHRAEAYTRSGLHQL